MEIFLKNIYNFLLEETIRTVGLESVVLGLIIIRTKKLIKLEEKIREKISIYAPLLTGIVVIFLGFGLLLAR